MNDGITPHIKLSLRNDEGESFMGIGLVWLLERVDRLKSIRKAAEDMKMSYMKAIKIINRLEENLGEKLLIRTIGGNTKGGSELTPFARKFLIAYKDWNSRLEKAVETGFREFMKKIPQ